MKLYGTLTSPYVRHVRIACIESGLDYELLNADDEVTAQHNPLLRVPFLIDGDITLTDSAVILRYIREKAGHTYLSTLEEHELFCTATAILDSAINLHLLRISESVVAKESNDIAISPGSGNYLYRQQVRIDSSLRVLNQRAYPSEAPYSDGELRLGVALAWGLFRKRFSIEGLDNLQSFLAGLDSYAPFEQTRPKA